MSPDDQALLHVALMKALRAKGDIGMPESRLIDVARIAGHDISQPSLRVELRALADKGWIAEMPQQLGTTRYRLTSLGSSILEEQRL